MKTLIIILLLACTGCVRSTFRYGEDGKLVKEPRLRPNGKGYAITVVIGYEMGQEIKYNIKK